MYKVSSVAGAIRVKYYLKFSICLIFACKIITLCTYVNQFNVSSFFYFFRRRPPPVSDHFVVHQGRSLTRELTVQGNGWIAKEGQVGERYEIIGMCFNLRGWIYYQGTWTL